ncbi:hypothetical protein BC826DRAFT_33813 [Russula brevipes]|nr:hypothetical protein BC826DRAFT_33813 [Russula brevipes]
MLRFTVHESGGVGIYRYSDNLERLVSFVREFRQSESGVGKLHVTELLQLQPPLVPHFISSELFFPRPCFPTTKAFSCRVHYGTVRSLAHFQPSLLVTTRPCELATRERSNRRIPFHLVSCHDTSLRYALLPVSPSKDSLSSFLSLDIYTSKTPRSVSCSLLLERVRQLNNGDSEGHMQGSMAFAPGARWLLVVSAPSMKVERCAAGRVLRLL